MWIFEIISISIIIRSKMVPKMFPWASCIRLEIVFDESRARCLYFLWNLWIFCEKLSIFCEFYEITDNPIIIHDRMIVWTQFVYLETMFDEFGEQCLIFLWNHWIICEKILWVSKYDSENHSVVDNYGFTWNFKKFTKNSSFSQIIPWFHTKNMTSDT